jgi:sulfur-carrier protein
MSVVFHIPGYLRDFTGGRREVRIAGAPATVGDALNALWSIYPGLRDRLVTEQGEVRQHINVFVGSECVRFTGGLATPVPEGSEVLIVPAVSGG